LPAVEPGFQPGGKNLTQNQRLEIVQPITRFTHFSGRQDAALYVRLEA
jgi:uncharacterized protein YeaC (DUF1315 family)